jgi:hypothetical protein
MPGIIDRDDEVDYGPLLGFTPPAVRIDPHTRDITPPATLNLRKAIEIVRRRQDSRVDEVKAAAAAE